MTGQEGRCRICSRPVANKGECAVCICLILGSFVSVFPGMWALYGLLSILHINAPGSLLLLVPALLFFPCLCIITIFVRAARVKGREGLAAVLKGATVNFLLPMALLFAIYLCVQGVGWIFGQFTAMNDGSDALKFKEPVTTAMAIKWENPNRPKVYPLHSLVVFSSPVRIQDKPMQISDEDFTRGSDWNYENACPGEWLARKKEEVKVVAVVGAVSSRVIGTYMPSNQEVALVDLDNQSIVGKQLIYERDPAERSADPWSGSWSAQPPSNQEVISAIRKTVFFTE